MKEPLVSVVVTAYQHERYIRDCLESILYQTYQNIELIIIDDASQDKTQQIIQSYVEKLQKKCVRLECIFHEKNVRCVSKVVNEGIRKCTGEYIKPFSGDDVMLPELLEQLVACSEKQSEYGCVLSNIYIMEERWHIGDKIDCRNTFYVRNGKSVYPPFRSYPQLKSEKMFKRLMIGGNYIPSIGMMIHKSVFQKYGLYNEDGVLEDYELWLRWALNKVRITWLDKALALYRVTSTGLSAGKSRENHLNLLNWQIKTKKLYLKHLTPKDRSECIMRVYKAEINRAKVSKWHDLYFVFYCRLLKYRLKQWIYRKQY